MTLLRCAGGPLDGQMRKRPPAGCSLCEPVPVEGPLGLSEGQAGDPAPVTSGCCRMALYRLARFRHDERWEEWILEYVP